jgi:hypothetical protein
MKHLDIDEETITDELRELWSFYERHVDWEAVDQYAKHVGSTYNGVNQRLDGMTYDEKLMIHALISLGAALGQASTPIYVISTRGDGVIADEELN